MIKYSIWQASLRKNVMDAMGRLKVAWPAVRADTIALDKGEYNKIRKQIVEKKCLVVFSLGRKNPWAPDWRKVERIMQIDIMYKNFPHDEHGLVIDAVQEQFEKGLNMTLWNPHGGTDISGYTVAGLAVVEDVREGVGYNGDDGRFVVPLALNVKIPEF